MKIFDYVKNKKRYNKKGSENGNIKKKEKKRDERERENSFRNESIIKHQLGPLIEKKSTNI